MKNDNNKIFAISSYEMFFDGECENSLKNMTEKLGEGCSYDFDSYSITGIFSQIIQVPVHELGIILGMLRQNGVKLAHGENCTYSGSNLNIVKIVQADEVGP